MRNKNNNINLKNGTVGAWAYLVNPDTRFNKTEYKATLIYDEEEVQETIMKLETQIDKRYEEEVGKAKPNIKASIQKAYPFETYYDKDGKEVEGKVCIKVKSKYQPKTFGMDGKETKPKDIFMGSKLNIQLQANLYFMARTKKVGVSFLINGIQIVELVDSFDEDFKDKEKKPEVNASNFGFDTNEIEETTSNF